MIAVPTVAPSVTNSPSTGPNNTPLPAARIGPGTKIAPSARRHHDKGQRRERTRGGDRAPDILDVDYASDRNQIEQPEQERREQGEPHDVASSGGGGGPVVVGHAGSDSPAPSARVGSVAMTGDGWRPTHRRLESAPRRTGRGGHRRRRRHRRRDRPAVRPARCARRGRRDRPGAGGPDPRRGEQTRADRIRCHVVDVTVDDDVARLAEDVLAEHGRVDVLVNNVGDYRPLVPFHRSTPDSWQQMYDVNLRHVFAVTRAFVPSMIDAHRGSIVTVHSVEGMRGYPKDPVYGAMKAAAAHFTTCLAVDLGRHGIRVNGIGTDLAQTPQVDYLTGYEDVDDLWASWAPVGRVGWPEDQARVALFLASDQSAFVTGHNIPVDGGTKAGGGWLFSPREGRFVNRSRNL